jgi:lysine biosynthesis protein LysW
MQRNMSQKCVECGGTLDVPKDVEKGDIFSCPDCGVDYVIDVDEDGKKQIKELNLEEEDWGE